MNLKTSPIAIVMNSALFCFVSDCTFFSQKNIVSKVIVLTRKISSSSTLSCFATVRNYIFILAVISLTGFLQHIFL
jgi:cellulose synthase/poly-beta-1,6-N-acetylglucosamine synthase-like glycosyltransferase